jgi:hypothetical protein
MELSVERNMKFSSNTDSFIHSKAPKRTVLSLFLVEKDGGFWARHQQWLFHAALKKRARSAARCSTLLFCEESDHFHNVPSSSGTTSVFVVKLQDQLLYLVPF